MKITIIIYCFKKEPFDWLKFLVYVSPFHLS